MDKYEITDTDVRFSIIRASLDLSLGLVGGLLGFDNGVGQYVWKRFCAFVYYDPVNDST